MLVWLIPLAIFVVLFIPSIMIQSHFLYRQKANKVQGYETQAIELEENVVHEADGIWVSRVGIKALGQKAVRGVLVYLTYYDGNENGLRDAPLRPANRIRNTTGAITINPGNTQTFVEVLHWNPFAPEMGIPYYLNYQLQQSGIDIHKSLDSLPTKIDVGEHIITLYATGEDIKPVEITFKVSIVGDKLQMKRQ